MDRTAILCHFVSKASELSLVVPKQFLFRTARRTLRDLLKLSRTKYLSYYKQE